MQPVLPERNSNSESNDGGSWQEAVDKWPVTNLHLDSEEVTHEEVEPLAQDRIRVVPGCYFIIVFY
jgi:hypothetical protein